ncbi:MAG: carbohydrate ABC transporter permease [Finegoldia magna]|uniref:carbohydrate ABC transporter permease n=1 Tax=Finegoldia magna TaxID=1260 RepID=UPI0026F2C614|nr:carbohydrate ABC transporter permease [Finegoldia magna]MBS5776206.1 carbohydrate ABC transporter permease [Finegoldia magna]MBS5941700.1 carbohydrate ABC transporter permease [Finegoldia magna]MBS5966867.1 carbohydrate ABC transporter permease [Finegoldia magna]MDU1579231.1 carbohydrate ABC transporter permease [Finegoldia magna]MDU1599776.1 carbohydrate ABC transporter permease [Finegoldia magna]
MNKIKKIINLLLLAFVSILAFFPLLWMATNSFKTANKIIQQPLNLFPEVLDFRNFIGALEKAPFDLYIINSIITAFAIVVLQLLLGILMGYGLSKFDFKGKKILFGSILLTYMLPAAATYVPSYVILAKMNLIDTIPGIIISNVASVFTIYMVYQTFSSVPKEMIEAAEMDGANNWQILWKVMVPLSKSTILTTALIQFVIMYNNYMWPSLITNSKKNYLISVGLNIFFNSKGNFTQNLPMLMAANTISVLPLLILFLILKKWFIEGISDSGIKG